MDAKKTGLAALLGLSLALGGLRAETVKDDLKEAGHETKKAAKEVGHGVKKAGKKVGHATRDAAKEIGHGFKKAAKKAKEDAKD